MITMGEQILDLEKTPFIEEIYTDLNEHHKGRFVVITGPPGEAKSATGMRICEKVDDTFNVERIAVGRTTDFLRMLRDAVKGEYRHGQAIMLDEAGVGIGAREWNSAQNRVMTLIFQTIRKLGLLVVLTVPAKRMVDVHSQILMNYYCNAHYVDYKAKRSVFSIYKISYDDWNDVLKRYLLKDEHGNKISLWKMALPQTIDLDAYEKRKDEMLEWLFGRAEDIFSKLEEEAHAGNGNGKIKGYVSTERVVESALKLGITDTKSLLQLTGLNSSSRVRELRARIMQAQPAIASPA
jgi:hypothetical protein